jgi:hypothetical protein
LAAALFVVALTPPAFAQELDDATRSAARDLASEGSGFYESGNFEQAYDRFARAYQLVHAPTVGIWAARSLVKLGRLIEASERFLELERQELATDAPPEHHKAKEEAAAERQALAPRIPSVRVLVEGAQPNEVFVTLNGELLPAPLVGAKRPVNPGKLAIKATRGADTVEAAVELREGETRDVKLAFVARPAPGAAPIAAAPIAPEPVPPDDGGGSAQRTVGWVALGVGGTGLAVGGIFGILGLSDKSDLEASCPDRRCEPDQYDALDAYETKKTISTVGLIGGAVLGVTGAVLIVTAPDGASPSAARSRKLPRLGAFVGPDRVGVFGAFE